MIDTYVAEVYVLELIKPDGKYDDYDTVMTSPDPIVIKSVVDKVMKYEGRHNYEFHIIGYDNWDTPMSRGGPDKVFSMNYEEWEWEVKDMVGGSSYEG